MTDVRPEVVSLLADVHMNKPVNRWREWTHLDGRPLTPEEIDLIGSSTAEEMRAAADYARRASEYHAGRQADFERAQELMDPYFTKLPEGTVIGDILPLMPDAERDELNAIFDRLAPDGHLWIDRS